MNSAGNVLAWALSFEDRDQIPRFLDHVENRYREAPNERNGVVAERFRKFPGRKAGPDHREFKPPPAIPPSHSAEAPCPAAISLPAGGLSGTIVGRVLNENGEPVPETIRQENYLEARVEIPPGAVSDFLELAESKREFPVPDSFTQAIVDPAYLGQLDVDPSGTVPGSRNLSDRADLRAVRVPGTSPATRFRIRGTSDIQGMQRPAAGQRNGRDWEHRVTLEWDGFAEIDLRSGRMIKLVMLANGTERLRWGNENLLVTREPAAAHLMAGHAIDFDGEVRYGLIAERIGSTELEK